MSKPYAIEYRHNGKTRLMRLDATSEADAQAQLNSAFYNGEIQETVARVPVPSWAASLIGGY